MKMELMGKLGKYDKEDWVLFDYAQEQFEKLGDAQKKEELDIERYGFSEEGDWVGEYASNMVLDDINTMKDIVSFAEINRYRGTLLADMSESEKIRVIPLILESLSGLNLPPTAYAVKDDVVVLAWYLNNVMWVWMLSECFESINLF